MAEKLSQSSDQTNLDEYIIFLTYEYVKNAMYSMDVLNRAVKRYCLDSDLTPGVKRALKKDLGFTSQAVYSLGEAKRCYEGFIKHLGVVENQLDGYVNPKNYDLGMAACEDMMAVDLLYLSITDGQPEKRVKIHNYLGKFKIDNEVLEAYNLLQKKAERLAKKGDY